MQEAKARASARSRGLSRGTIPIKLEYSFSVEHELLNNNHGALNDLVLVNDDELYITQARQRLYGVSWRLSRVRFDPVNVSLGVPLKQTNVGSSTMLMLCQSDPGFGRDHRDVPLLCRLRLLVPTVARGPLDIAAFCCYLRQWLAWPDPLHGPTMPDSIVEYLSLYATTVSALLQIPLTPVIHCTGVLH